MRCLMCKQLFTPLIKTNPRCQECTIRAAENAGGDVKEQRDLKKSRAERREALLKYIKKQQ